MRFIYTPKITGNDNGKMVNNGNVYKLVQDIKKSYLHVSVIYTFMNRPCALLLTVIKVSGVPSTILLLLIFVLLLMFIRTRIGPYFITQICYVVCNMWATFEHNTMIHNDNNSLTHNTQKSGLQITR